MAETTEAKPSQAREPEISFEVISRPSPPETMAVVSPMVSAAETIKIMATEKMAPIWNSGAKGRSAGRETIPSEKITDRSTLPINTARIYPTTSPASTDSCFRYPRARMFQPRQTVSVTVPRSRLEAEPKSSA